MLNSAPSLAGLAASQTFGENLVNATPQLIDSDVTFTDVEGNFNGGTLRVSGVLSEDRIGIRTAGLIAASGGSVSYNGTTIGSYTGGAGSSFSVSLNAAATSVAVDALIQNLTYANVSDTPTASRTLTINVFDAAGDDIEGAPSFTQLTGANDPFGGFSTGIPANQTDFILPAAIDFDGDGDLDIVTGFDDGTLWAFQNNNGFFTRITGASNPFNGVDLGVYTNPASLDIDGDGDLDLVAGSAANLAATTGQLHTFRNNGNGTFTELVGAGVNPFHSLSTPAPLQPGAGDFDGDGDDDLFLLGVGAGAPIQTYRNDGNGTFTQLSGAGVNPFHGVSSGTVPIGFVDTDHDGDLDAVLGTVGGTFRYFRNNGNSTFTELSGAGANPYFGIGTGAYSSPVFIDIDGDSDLDLLSGSSRGILTAWRNGASHGAQITINVTAEAEPNAAPTVNANLGLTLNEGASGTITTARLDFNDAEQADTAITYTISAAATNGTLFRNGVALANGSSFTQADINNGLITYTHNGGETTSASFGFSVSDGAGGTVTGQSFAFTVTPVNDAPVLDLGGTNAGYTENDTGVAIAPAPVIIDPDNADMASATISLSDAAAGDRLFVSGALPAGITISGSSTDVLLILTGAASNAAYRTAIGQIRYTSDSDNPTALDTDNSRTINVQVNDGAADSNITTFLVVITSVDDAPVAVADTPSTTESATIDIAVLANDTDVDAGPIAISSVEGTPLVTPGDTVTLASGAIVTLNADGTLNYDPNGRFSYLVSAATAAASGAVNVSATDSFSYTLNGGNSATVTVTVTGEDSPGDQLRGDAGDNSITGTPDNDLFVMGAGTDSASGGGGSDGFYFGAFLDDSDTVDGGETAGDDDQLALQGNYVATLQPGHFTGIETLVLLSGTDTRFGEPGTNSYFYNLTMLDADVGAGQKLTVNANMLTAGEDLTFNGTAESDGYFFVYAGLGTDELIGGSNNDAFYFGGDGRFTAADHIDGHLGSDDQLGLRGDYTVTFTATTMVNIDTLALMSAQDNRFAAPGDTFDYDITLADANVAAGALLTVTANTLRAGESATVDASRDSDSRFRFYGGAGDDSFSGGALADEFFGRGGADVLTGGEGNDVFFYRATSDSVGGAFDRIADFALGDTINLATIDAQTGTPANDAFSYIADAAFGGLGAASAGQLRAFLDGSGDWMVEGDTNGDGIADFMLAVTTVGGHALVGTDFVL